MRARTVKVPSLAAAEKKLGPARSWSGRCYEMACKLVESGLVEGVAVYGHWRGPVAPGSYFGDRHHLPFVQHGWVLLPDGSVVDPTRWSFDGSKPYIFHGPCGPEYDEGGNQFRRETLQPPPEFDVYEKLIRLPPRVLPSSAWNHIEKLLQLDYGFTEQEPGVLCMSQFLWVCNLPFNMLGKHAKHVYDSADRVGLRGLVPIDNWMKAQRESKEPTHDHQGIVRRNLEASRGGSGHASASARRHVLPRRGMEG